MFARGRRATWYLYPATRESTCWCAGACSSTGARRGRPPPVAAWAAIRGRGPRRDYTKRARHGRHRAASWDEVNEIIAAANAYTDQIHGPDRVLSASRRSRRCRWSATRPAAHTSLLGGVCMSSTTGTATAAVVARRPGASRPTYPVGRLVQLRTSSSPGAPTSRRRARPDAHFFTEVRAGTKTVAVTPDYSEVAKFADIWMKPKRGTDAAVAMAMGHVILGSRSTGGPHTSTTTCAAPTCRCW